MSRATGPVARALVAVALGVVVAGCLGRDARPEMRLLAWSEYVPQSVIDGFSDAYGVRVLYESVGSNEEMLRKLAAQPTRYDLASRHARSPRYRWRPSAQASLHW